MLGYTSMSNVTRLIEAAQMGDRQAASDLLPLVYDKLRKLAAVKIAGEAPGHTLDATALVPARVVFRCPRWGVLIHLRQASGDLPMCRRWLLLGVVMVALLGVAGFLLLARWPVADGRPAIQFRHSFDGVTLAEQEAGPRVTWAYARPHLHAEYRHVQHRHCSVAIRCANAGDTNTVKRGSFLRARRVS
jgi:hypothetical protein